MDLAGQARQSIIHQIVNEQMHQQAILDRAHQIYNSAVPAGSVHVPGTEADWIRRAISIMQAHGIHVGKGIIPGLESMISHESSGNPNAINMTGANAAAGTPPIGLMQTIQPTFDEWALPGYDQIRNPVDNIIAGVRYALDRYGKGMIKAGGLHNSKGQYEGY
jgi:hypothetical protein